MYKVYPVRGGHQVFWIEDSELQALKKAKGLAALFKAGRIEEAWAIIYTYAHPRPVRVKPFAQRTNAYRKAKELNDAARSVDEMIKRDGAIIL